MKIIYAAVLVALTLVAGVGRAQTRGGSDPLAIGALAPMTDMQVMTVSGSTTTFDAERGEGGLMVVFTCNTCPWVAKWEDRYEIVSAAARDAGLGVIMLNSNAALRDGDESLDAMKTRAKASDYTFAYAVDPDAAIADAFGATRTPEVFLFNKEMRLFYHGAIDDNARDASDVETPFVMNALASYKAGEVITQAETNSIGCTIKRKRG
jgi:hypothetical protein